MKRKKPTPTVKYLQDLKVGETVNVPLPPDFHEHLHFDGGRMNFQNITTREIVDWENVARFIRNYASKDMCFYVDANMFIGEEKPDNFWQSLLEKEIVITPSIEHELAPWMKSPNRNLYAHKQIFNALKNENPHIRFAKNTNFSAASLFSIEYYTCLLLVRKQLAKWEVDSFVETNGREPTKEELQKIINQKAADHERRLINKGLDDIGKSNWFSDEELVVTAAIDAIANHREVTLVSTDGDIQTQFVKLMQLLCYQFQGFRFAEIYSEDDSRFRTFELTHFSKEVDLYFARDVQLVEKPETFIDLILEVDSHSIPIHSLQFGGQGDGLLFAPLSYTLESDMIRLLKTKLETGGRNTSCLGSLNCHVTGLPRGIEHQRQRIAIATDKYMEAGKLQIPKIDIAHAGYSKGLPLS